MEVVYPGVKYVTMSRTHSGHPSSMFQCGNNSMRFHSSSTTYIIHGQLSHTGIHGLLSHTGIHGQLSHTQWEHQVGGSQESKNLSCGPQMLSERILGLLVGGTRELYSQVFTQGSQRC